MCIQIIIWAAFCSVNFSILSTSISGPIVLSDMCTKSNYARQTTRQGQHQVSIVVTGLCTKTTTTTKYKKFRIKFRVDTIITTS